MLKPQYTLTNKIVSLLSEIAEARVVIERAKLLPKQELKLRRQALIRMTHSSTHIEGNILNVKQVEAVYAHQKVDAPDRDIYEVANYLKALKYIEKTVAEKKEITEKIVLKIHKLVTNKTLSKEQSGFYRNGQVYVVRRKGGKTQEIVYTAPNAKKVPELMKDLINWIKESKEKEIHPIVVAGIAHQEIAAIHPFADGNGRTARALATLILYQRGYDFRRLFALEDYYNKNRPRYYDTINIGKIFESRKKDSTNWLEYFIEGFKEEINNTKERVLSLSLRKIGKNTDSQVYLDKDQIKILDFLEQMGKITVKDAIDVLECPKRTAQLNFQKLKKLNLISQVGKGPSSAYILAE